MLKESFKVKGREPGKRVGFQDGRRRKTPRRCQGPSKVTRNKKTTHGLRRSHLGCRNDQVPIRVTRVLGPDALRTTSRLFLVEETLLRVGEAVRARVNPLVSTLDTESKS